MDEELKNLSEAAKEILRAAAQSRGIIELHRSDQSPPQIKAGGGYMGDVSDPASLAKYSGLLEVLCEKSYVTPSSNPTYRLTAKGFDAAELLQKESSA